MTTTTTGGARRGATAPPGPTAKAKVKRDGHGVRGSTLTFWLFAGPFLAGLLLFVYVTVGWSFYLSFFQAQNTVTPTKFVGLDNYADILTEGPFTESLWTFTLFALIVVPLTYVLALALALLVHRIR